jgi:hypothetical protein
MVRELLMATGAPCEFMSLCTAKGWQRLYNFQHFAQNHCKWWAETLSVAVRLVTRWVENTLYTLTKGLSNQYLIILYLIFSQMISDKELIRSFKSCQ